LQALGVLQLRVELTGWLQISARHVVGFAVVQAVVLQQVFAIGF
jgi:hypothetical protein